jgi:hypothetical protein
LGWTPYFGEPRPVIPPAKATWEGKLLLLAKTKQCGWLINRRAKQRKVVVSWRFGGGDYIAKVGVFPGGCGKVCSREAAHCLGATSLLE